MINILKISFIISIYIDSVNCT